MELKTYLAGAIQCVEDGGTQWRDKITPKLDALGITVQNPCKSETNSQFGGTIIETREQIKKFKRTGDFESFDKHMQEVIRDDLVQVQGSHFLIVYWSNAYKHGGTVHETVHAWQNHIPIYMVCYDPISEMNDWILALVRQNGLIFDNFGKLMTFLKFTYKKEIKELQKQKLEKESKKEAANEQ